MKWKNFKQSLWNEVKEQADVQIRQAEISFSGLDIDRLSMIAAKKNLFQLPYGDTVQFSRRDFLKDKISPRPDFLIMNPPYDVRLKSEDIEEFYFQIGMRLRNEYKGSRICVFSGNVDALHKIGLKADRKMKLMNGPIPSLLNCYMVN